MMRGEQEPGHRYLRSKYQIKHVPHDTLVTFDYSDTWWPDPDLHFTQ